MMGQYEVGDIINIMYNSENPIIVNVKMEVINIVVGIIFIIAGVFSIILGIKISR